MRSLRAASANTAKAPAKASAAIVADRIIIGLSSDHVISALASAKEQNNGTNNQVGT